MTTGTTTTFDIGGDLTVNRLGFGAMQLTGRGIWGEPDDREECVRVLRRAVELGVDLIDTANSYGPAVSEEIIREALHPYGDVRIATKGGFTRQGPNKWVVVGRPEYLRECVEMSMRRLGVETIDLYQLHRIDPAVPTADQLGVLKEMQGEGKIRYVGLSEVSVAEIEEAQRTVQVVTVQNMFNLAQRKSEDVLEHCEREGIGFMPWYPIANRKLAREGAGLDEIATRVSATPVQVALAWLLHRSPVMLPIPGTKSVAHLEENMGAGRVSLSEEDMAELSALA